MGAHFLLVLLALPQHPLQIRVGLLRAGKIYRIITLKHAGRFMPGDLYDHRLVYSRFSHIGVGGVAEIMKSEIINRGHPVGPPETSFD